MNPSGQTFASLVRDVILPLINAAIPVLAALAIAVFFIGVVRYVASAGGAKEKVQGRELLMWGIVALFVLFCIWGIVAILKTTFFGSSGAAGTSTDSNRVIFFGGPNYDY